MNIYKALSLHLLHCRYSSVKKMQGWGSIYLPSLLFSFACIPCLHHPFIVSVPTPDRATVQKLLLLSETYIYIQDLPSLQENPFTHLEKPSVSGKETVALPVRLFC